MYIYSIYIIWFSMRVGQIWATNCRGVLALNNNRTGVRIFFRYITKKSRPNFRRPPKINRVNPSAKKKILDFHPLILRLQISNLSETSTRVILCRMKKSVWRRSTEHVKLLNLRCIEYKVRPEIFKKYLRVKKRESGFHLESWNQFFFEKSTPIEHLIICFISNHQYW